MPIAPLVAGLFSDASPKEGDVAPDFTAQDSDGRSHTLSRLVERGPVILAFFPKAFTGGWTRELSAYRDRYADVEKLHGQVLAVSTDDADTLRRFKESLKAPFPFVPDPDGTLTRLYGVKTPVLTLSLRYTFVIDAGRRVVRVESGRDAIDPDAAIVACPMRGKGG